MQSIEWDYLNNQLLASENKYSLIFKIKISTFKIRCYDSSSVQKNEILEVVDLLSTKRQEFENYFTENIDDVLILEYFYEALAQVIDDRIFYEVSDEMKELILNLFQIKSLEWFKANLKFLVNLSANQCFIVRKYLFKKWLSNSNFQIFKIIYKGSAEKDISLDSSKLITTIFYNLLSNQKYGTNLLKMSSNRKELVDIIMKCRGDEYLWIKNVIIISFIDPSLLKDNIDPFLLKINRLIFNEIDKPNHNNKFLNNCLNLLMKFCGNIFKNQNEIVIRKMLDTTLCHMMIKLLQKPNLDFYTFDRILKILVLFIVDDELIDFFFNNNLPHIILKKVENYSELTHSIIINTILICKTTIELKPYAFSKYIKVDLLAFLLVNYSRSTNSIFKSDLINLLIRIYQNKDFRQLILETEVIFF